MIEGGYWIITDPEVAALRKYLLQGEFVILDDSRDGRTPGSMGYANIEANSKRIFPELHFVDPSWRFFWSFPG